MGRSNVENQWRSADPSCCKLLIRPSMSFATESWAAHALGTVHLRSARRHPGPGMLCAQRGHALFLYLARCSSNLILLEIITHQVCKLLMVSTSQYLMFKIRGNKTSGASPGYPPAFGARSLACEAKACRLAVGRNSSPDVRVSFRPCMDRPESAQQACGV